MQEQDEAQQENTTAAAAAAAEKAEADTVAAENAEINAAAAESAASGTTDTETASGSTDGRPRPEREKDKGEESREIVCEIPASLYIPPKKKADDENWCRNARSSMTMPMRQSPMCSEIRQRRSLLRPSWTG